MKKKSKLLSNGLILIHVIFAIFGLYLYIKSYNLSENLLIQKTLDNQLILAKSGSLSVENLLNNVQSQLSSFVFSFTKIDESASINKDATRAEFKDYMQRAELPINGIALYDEQGTLSVIDNRNHLRIGEDTDYSQTKLIEWAKNPLNMNKVFISTPYIGVAGASVAKIIIVVAKPVYFGNRYKGVLAIRLLVDEFTKIFVTPLSSDTNEDTFIVDSNGVVIAGKNTLLNKNLFTYAKKQKWNTHEDFTRKLNLAIKKTYMQTTWTFQSPNEKSKIMFVGISKIDVPNTDKDLYMIVTTSKEGVLSLLSGLRHYGYAWLGFGVLTTIVGSLIVIFVRSSY